MKQLELRWHGHACFSLTYDGYTVVFDPYEDNYVPGFAPLDLEADLVLCSHQHKDHNAAHVVRMREGKENPFIITPIETFHDPAQGELRGKNTIYLLEAGGMRVAHFGDLGCELTEQQIDRLYGLDAAMIPVGGFFTIDAAQAKTIVDQIKPKVMIPMHYRMDHIGLPVVTEVTDFLELVEDHVYYPTNTLIINEGTKPQIAVLSYTP